MIKLFPVPKVPPWALQQRNAKSKSMGHQTDSQFKGNQSDLPFITM